MAFFRVYGLLFTNKNIEKYQPTVDEFLSLLDNQIGRVTRKLWSKDITLPYLRT